MNHNLPADTTAVVAGAQSSRKGRTLGLITAGAKLGSAALTSIGPSLAGAAAITSSVKPIVWTGLGSCEYRVRGTRNLK